MQERFNDLSDLNIPDWNLNPSEVQPTQVEAEIQESFIDLQNDLITYCQFNQFQKDFWIKSDLLNKFPTLLEKAQHFFYCISLNIFG